MNKIVAQVSNLSGQYLSHRNGSGWLISHRRLRGTVALPLANDFDILQWFAWAEAHPTGAVRP